MNLKKFERYPLTFGKTPIDYLPRLSKEINGNLEIYAKRDDCNSGLAFGGNKLRKLEYPAIEDQLDLLYHEGIEGWKKIIKETKDKYPKPIVEADEPEAPSE